MSRIVIHYMHGRGLVFNVDDYLKLRFEYRIIGNLIGVPVSHPRDTNQQGMPAVLSACELKFLLEKQIVQLIDKNKMLQKPPNNEQIQLYNNIIDRQKEEMRLPIIEKRMEAFKKHLPRILEGKRKKLLKSGLKEQALQLNAEQLVQEERAKIQQQNLDTMIQIPLKHPVLVDFSEASIDLSTEERVKYRVYESLWNEGGFITTGDSFGCDFLLYPGDPMYFHASHMIHVLHNGSCQRTDVKYLIRLCRLSVVVNKLCVVAYVDEDTNEVHFETLEWEGNVNKGEII
ncbi:uncharacterized protein LOC128729454 [Anopheles nili]|uniref:uncharacterized protein LOC128729454 n=1 Tax=Anopheles nili TaxID=185578 RepID=UPI00237B23BB|nr:uncharacterized protein LOC128729454 [Anopheles nili]